MEDTCITIEKYKIDCMLENIHDLLLCEGITYKAVESILLNLVDDDNKNEINEIIYDFLIAFQ